VVAAQVAADVRLRIEASTLAVVPNGRQVSGTLHVRIANAASRSVFYVPCAALLERRDGAQWVPTYAPICSLAGTPPVEVRGGEEQVFEVPLVTMQRIDGAPPGAPLVRGEYRVHLTTLRTTGARLPEAARVTEAFTL
jgi:hypothetical protein